LLLPPYSSALQKIIPVNLPLSTVINACSEILSAYFVFEIHLFSEHLAAEKNRGKLELVVPLSNRSGDP